MTRNRCDVLSLLLIKFVDSPRELIGWLILRILQDMGLIFSAAIRLSTELGWLVIKDQGVV